LEFPAMERVDAPFRYPPELGITPSIIKFGDDIDSFTDRWESSYSATAVLTTEEKIARRNQFWDLVESEVALPLLWRVFERWQDGQDIIPGRLVLDGRRFDQRVTEMILSPTFKKHVFLATALELAKWYYKGSEISGSIAFGSVEFMSSVMHSQRWDKGVSVFVWQRKDRMRTFKGKMYFDETPQGSDKRDIALQYWAPVQSILNAVKVLTVPSVSIGDTNSRFSIIDHGDTLVVHRAAAQPATSQGRDAAEAGYYWVEASVEVSKFRKPYDHPDYKNLALEKTQFFDWGN